MLLPVSTVQWTVSATLDQNTFITVPPSRDVPRLYDGLSHSSREKVGEFLLLGSRAVTQYAEEIIGDHQCGFRRNRLTTDHIMKTKNKTTICTN